VCRIIRGVVAPAVGLERNPADLQLLTHDNFRFSSATYNCSFNTPVCLRLPFTGAFTGGRHKPTPPQFGHMPPAPWE